MKKVFLLVALVAMTASLAFAVLPAPDQTKDVLGAHMVYGRGCEGCHVPHSGPRGNGNSGEQGGGDIALWGQDMMPLYGQSLSFGDGTSFPVTLPNTSGGTVQVNGNTVNPIANPTHSTPLWSTMACLSCHDGNLAKSTAMQGTTVEALQINGHVFNPPTLLGADGNVAGDYHNDHPIGPSATVGCGTWDWDCSFSGGNYTLGPNQTLFAANYMNPVAGILRSTVKGGDANGNYVVCTTCHDQHSMTAYKATVGAGGGASTQYVKTTFFLRGYYDNSTGGNNTAQFCRQCHGGEANEMHGVYNVPTT